MFRQRPSRPRAFPHLLTAPAPLPVRSQSALMGLSVPSRRPPTPPELSVNSSIPRLALHPGPWRGVACHANCPGLCPQFGGLLPCAQTSLPAPCPRPSTTQASAWPPQEEDRTVASPSPTAVLPSTGVPSPTADAGPLLQRAPNESQQP